MIRGKIDAIYLLGVLPIDNERIMWVSQEVFSAISDGKTFGINLETTRTSIILVCYSYPIEVNDLGGDNLWQDAR